MLYKIKAAPEDFLVRELSDLSLGDKGRFCYFMMRKKDHTTHDAIATIAKVLHIPYKNVRFAGNKDKKAITEQIISICIDSQARVERLDLKDISLKFLGKSNDAMFMGNLKGNYFEIIVRDFNKKPKVLKTFINYYGEQRFSKNNVAIGKALLKKDFKMSCGLFMKHDAQWGSKIKEYLALKPNDFIGALRLLPKNIMKLMVHSVQSRIWNDCVKEYVAMEGSSDSFPIVGFGSEFANKEQEDIADAILEEHSLSPRDFIIREFPEISAEGDDRQIKVDVSYVTIEELNERAVKICFNLPKGCYATEYIAQVFA